MALATAPLLAACGGGGDSSSGTSAPPPAASTTLYANSVVLGSATPQSIVYLPASGASQATVTTSLASTLLPLGTTAVLAEHVEPGLAGLREICVSGHGDSTNIVENINLGVVTESAAILMDASWSATDSTAAWAGAVANAGAFSGWQNCGAKPEGLPSRSSRLVPTPAGGYAEDVYDGNPGTNFNILRYNAAAADVAAMLAPAGLLSQNDPNRPLQLTLRAYGDGAGHVVFVESGRPAAGAPASTRGFVAVYVPGG